VFSGCSKGITETEAVEVPESVEEKTEDVEELEETEELEEIESTEEMGETVEEVEDPEPAEEMELTEEVEETEEVIQEVEDTPVQIKDISPEEVFATIENNEDYLIVDVRTREEYDGGHLKGALLIPVQELEGRVDELPKDKPVIVYCRSGSRSRSAAEILIANGFTMVYDMGGIISWIDEGYPVIVEE
jgi:rhodanese-related sulfurtransferase